MSRLRSAITGRFARRAGADPATTVDEDASRRVFVVSVPGGDAARRGQVVLKDGDRIEAAGSRLLLSGDGMRDRPIAYRETRL